MSVCTVLYPMNEENARRSPAQDRYFLPMWSFVCLHMLLLNPDPVNKYCSLTRALFSITIMQLLLPTRRMNFLYYCKIAVNFFFTKKREKTVNSPCSVESLTHGYCAAAYLSQIPVIRPYDA